MNSPMRPQFQRCLETNEIPQKTVYYGRLTLRRDQCHQGHDLIRKRRLMLTGKPMRQRICEGEAVCKSAVGDLITIVGVTPASEATGGIGVPERAVLEIRCVCYIGGQCCVVQTTCQNNTECPVPVRLSTLIPAFILKGSIEVPDIRTMPGQEVGSVVDLGSCRIIIQRG